MSAPVFISYSSKDQKIAETICQALEARGQNCWIACRDVRGGENFQEAIVRALREAKVMLLVFSSNANNSDEIKKELVLAGRYHVTVVPARVEDVVPNDAFSYELATRQWVDLFQDWEREIEKLSLQLAVILRGVDKPGAGMATAVPPPRPPRKTKSNNVLIAALAVLVLLLAGVLAYWKPWATPKTAATTPVVATAMPAAKPQTPVPLQATNPAPQTVAAAAATPAIHAAEKHIAPARAPNTQTAAIAPAASPPPSPPPQQAAPADPDAAAWQTAIGANSRAGFDAYLKAFPGGAHLQEAQLQLAMLILSAPATGAAFDGSWQTTWTCPNLGQYPGYSYQFSGQIRDGVYHGIRGTKGEPSSMTLEGKIEADGVAAFSGEVIVGSSLVGLGAARGTPSDFHALAQFDHNGGTGKRLEGRGCSLTFEKQ